MVDEEQPQQPDGAELIYDFMRRALGSVHDQVGAVRSEALDTSNTALNLAADAELRAASLNSKLESSQKDILSALGQNVSSTGVVSENLLKLSTLCNQVYSGILFPLVNTYHATQLVGLEWMMTISAWAAILPTLLQSNDKQAITEAALTFFEAVGKLAELMQKASWIDNIEARKNLSEEAHTIRREYWESTVSLLRKLQTVE